MQQFEILPHTADVRVRATGSTQAALLTASLQGMFAAAEPRYGGSNETINRPFKVESSDFPALLIDFLNEALAQSDTNHEAYDRVQFELITKTKAEGMFIGKPITGFETQIKAATHHDLNIKRHTDGTWEATVVFDA